MTLFHLKDSKFLPISKDLIGDQVRKAVQTAEGGKEKAGKLIVVGEFSLNPKPLDEVRALTGFLQRSPAYSLVSAGNTVLRRKLPSSYSSHIYNSEKGRAPGEGIKSTHVSSSNPISLEGWLPLE